MNASPPLFRHAGLLVSPDDGTTLTLHQGGGQSVFLAAGTGLLHPVIDNIAVLLSRDDRSCELEAGVLEAFLADDQLSPELSDAARRTLALLESRRGIRSFAWEDEEHWNKEYAATENAAADDTKWNDRIWQHQNSMATAGVRGTMTILDIGCGEGQLFRQLFRQRIAPESLYIGADISLAGLKLNRKLNAWPNALYILCSADSLPLAPSSVDLICYFGVLHHTKNKEKNLPVHLGILKPGGRIILSEAIERARILSDRFRPGESAHEERFDVRDLQTILAASPEKVRVLSWKTRLSVFYSGAARLLGSKLVRTKPIYDFLAAVDHLCIATLGRVLPWFRGAEVMTVLERPAKPAAEKS
jgi:SAM-dependent methyltransferase